MRPVIIVILISLSLAACSAAPKSPELALIYSPAAKHQAPDRNPIIVIPGILGSKLIDRQSGKIIWGAFEGKYANPANPDDLRLLALPISRDGNLTPRAPGKIEPDGVLDRIKFRILGIPIQLQAYANILSTLGAGGYRDESLGLLGKIDYGTNHFTCFQFAYDWRLDNVENAKRLHQFILKKRAEVQSMHKVIYGIENSDVKFDIAAHSMGGLLVRYFLRYGSQGLGESGEGDDAPKLTWEGAKYVERVVIIAPPNAGTAEALEQLVKGKDIGRPFLPFYPAALLGTYPSLYQMLPRNRHKRVIWNEDSSKPVSDLYDPELWQKMHWGLSSPKQDKALAILMPDVADAEQRMAYARAHQRRLLKQARLFHQAIDKPATPPEHLELYLVSGDAEPTSAILSINSKTGKLSVFAREPGDGTVLRQSSLIDERADGVWQPHLRSPIKFEQVLFLPNNHLGLTKSKTFRDNVLYWLLEKPR